MVRIQCSYCQALGFICSWETKISQVAQHGHGGIIWKTRNMSIWLTSKRRVFWLLLVMTFAKLNHGCTGEGNGNPLLYSCLENPMDRRAWWARVHGITKSLTEWLTHTHTHKYQGLHYALIRIGLVLSSQQILIFISLAYQSLIVQFLVWTSYRLSTKIPWYKHSWSWILVSTSM